MWILTTFGFFSVVAHRDLPDSLLVRARVRADLDALLARMIVPDRPPVECTPDADYRYRAVVPRSVFATILALAIEGIDYANFKDAVHERQGFARALLYSNVWDQLRGVEALDKPWNAETGGRPRRPRRAG